MDQLFIDCDAKGYTSLKKINASNNKILKLLNYYDQCVFPNIEEFDVSNNQINVIASGSNILSMGKLKAFDLSGSGNSAMGDINRRFVSDSTDLGYQKMNQKDYAIEINSSGSGAPLKISIKPVTANECNLTQEDLAIFNDRQSTGQWRTIYTSTEELCNITDIPWGSSYWW